jgi:hypothetical protein
MRATAGRAMLLKVPVLLTVVVDAVHFVCRYRDTRHLFDSDLTVSHVNRLFDPTNKRHVGPNQMGAFLWAKVW